MIPHGAQARKLLRALWFAAIVVVIIASLLPSTSFPLRELDKLDISDKLEHGLAYLVLALLPMLHERRRFVVWAALGAVGLGVALEYAQLYSGWRDFEYGDMVADAAGACAGVLAGWPLRGSRFVRSIVEQQPGGGRDVPVSVRR